MVAERVAGVVDVFAGPERTALGRCEGERPAVVGGGIGGAALEEIAGAGSVGTRRVARAFAIGVELFEMGDCAAYDGAGDLDVARLEVAVVRAVVDLELDRAGRGGGVDGVGVLVGDRAQGGLVSGEGCGTGDGEGADGGCEIDDGAARRGADGEDVLGGIVVRRDLDGGAFNHVAGVGVGDGDGAADLGGHVALGVHDGGGLDTGEDGGVVSGDGALDADVIEANFLGAAVLLEAVLDGHIISRKGNIEDVLGEGGSEDGRPGVVAVAGDHAIEIGILFHVRAVEDIGCIADETADGGVGALGEVRGSAGKVAVDGDLDFEDVFDIEPGVGLRKEDADLEIIETGDGYVVEAHDTVGSERVVAIGGRGASNVLARPVTARLWGSDSKGRQVTGIGVGSLAFEVIRAAVIEGAGGIAGALAVGVEVLGDEGRLAKGAGGEKQRKQEQGQLGCKRKAERGFHESDPLNLIIPCPGRPGQGFEKNTS